jgi:hypothetical protein
VKLFKIIPSTIDFGTLEIFNTEELLKNLGVVRYRKLRSVQSSIVDVWPKSHGGFYNMYSADAEEISSVPDVYIWMNVFLVLSPKAKEILSPLLTIFGEFLPFECNEKIYFIFVVHSLIEPDTSESEVLINNEVYAGISSLVFKSEIVGSHILFKTSFDRFSHLYCTEKFRNVVETNFLTGISFSTDLSSKV